jgi:hypothetical protein
VYDTLMESDTVDPNGLTEGDTGPGRQWSDRLRLWSDS